MALSKNNRLHEVAMQKLNSMDTPVLLKVSFPQGLRTLSENDPAMLRLLGTDVQAFWDRIAQDPDMVGAGFKATPKATQALGKFSGLSGIKSKANVKGLTQALKLELTGKTPNPDKVAKAWIELLSNNSRNLFTVLMLSLQLNEKMPAKIWEMANELMIIDEIKFMHDDINDHALEQVEKVLSNYQEAMRLIDEELDKVEVTTNEYDQDQEIIIRESDQADLDRILDRVLGDHNGQESRPDMQVGSYEVLKRVCQYICEHEGCLIPRIEVDAPDHLADINEIKRTLDIIEQNPQEGLSLLRSQVGMVGGIEYSSTALRLEPKPPISSD